MTHEPEPIRGEPDPRGAGEFANPEIGFDPGIALAATLPALISGFEAGTGPMQSPSGAL